jgi:hypothetical protein
MPALWTVESIARERENAASVRAWQGLASAVRAHLAENCNGGDDFESAVQSLTGANLVRGLLHSRLGRSSEPTFEMRRVAPLKAKYGLADLAPTEHARPRVLILHAAEATLVPYAEGALRASRWAPSRARWDVRTAFHVVTRWASNHEPMLARLAVQALTIHGSSRPWRPWTKMYELTLSRHEPNPEVRVDRATALSSETTRVLLESTRDGHPHGHAVRELMGFAERLGVLPPRPRFERDEASRRQSELTRLLLDLEVRRPLDISALRLLDIIEVERQRK